MITIDAIRDLALTLPEATEEPHFEKTSFRIAKKIFATMDTTSARLTIKLSEIDQNVFGSHDKTIIYPVPNKWGKQGWTIIELDRVHPDLLKDAMIAAYCQVAPKCLAAMVKTEE